MGNLACFETKACTEIGCANTATIRVVGQVAGAVPPLALELDVDGRRVTCPAPLRSIPGGNACDDPMVFAEHRDQVDCTETRTAQAVSQSCSPNGKTEVVITLSGTPRQVAVTLKISSDVVIGQRSFEFRYSTVRPNGEGCEPACQQAVAMWPLP